MPDDRPGPDALRHALSEQTSLLTSHPTPEVLTVRLTRVLDAAGDLLDLADEGTSAAVQDLVSRTLTWAVERTGHYNRLPSEYAERRSLDSGRSTLLGFVDDLDLLGLTLDHAYDAAARGDTAELDRQLSLVADRFPSQTDIDHLLTPAEPLVDPITVQANGTEVGADGIPRLPVPEQPDPHHLREGS